MSNEKSESRIIICANTKPEGCTRSGERDNVYFSGGIMGALNATDYKQPRQVCIPVLTPDRVEKRQNGRRFKENGDDSFTLTSQDRHGLAIEVREAVRGGTVRGMKVIQSTLHSQTAKHEGEESEPG